MIVLRRNTERRHIRSGNGEMLCTFYSSENPDAFLESFGVIAVLNEYLLPSNESILTELVHGTELITYVHKGSLALEGPENHSGVITAGEFQCMTIVRGYRQRTTNTSRTDLAHFFRLYLRMPSSQSEADRINAQTRFTAAQRRNVLCMVASSDIRQKSLRLKTDVHVYSSILDPGHHIVYELLQGRNVWLHIVYGKVTANKINLSGGDGMGISDDSSLSLTAGEKTELLLVDTIEDNRGSHQKTT